MKRTYDLDEARGIAESLEIDFVKSEFDLAQFLSGLDVEAEHGGEDPATNVTQDDPLATGKIALAHLKEMPDYYTRLNKMETDAKPMTTPDVTSMASGGRRKGRLAAGLLIGLAVLVAGIGAVLRIRKSRG
jgi:hypothetical protein